MNKKILIAIIGQPNVGKSTFINRLTGKKIAIVHSEAGITRDRQYLECEWGRNTFTAIDTGGIIFKEQDSLLCAVQKQIEIAMEEADFIIFLLDAKTGITPVDQEIALRLKKQSKPVFVTVNKIDNPDNDYLTAEFYSLGLGEPYPISAFHGIGIGELLDEIFSKFENKNPPLPTFTKGGLEEWETSDETNKIDVVKLAIVGKPNVGKSSIINAVLGEDRMIVHHIAGTTRDAVDSSFTYQDHEFTLIDTAGLRRKARVTGNVEFYSVNRALKAIKKANVAGVVIDSSEGVTDQDFKIINLVIEQGKALFIVANKQDLIKKDKLQLIEIHNRLSIFNFIPVIHTSAITKKNLFDIFSISLLCLEENQRRISTGLLNKIMNEITGINPPPSVSGKHLKIYYVTQADIGPPTILLFVNDPKLLMPSYLKYIEQKVRENFGFSGTPIRLIPKKGE